jgi:hypothetical protein
VGQSGIASAFQALAKGDGVWGRDLKSSLNSNLKVIRDCLRIDTEDGDDDVSRTVAHNLIRLIENLNPPRPYGGELSPGESRARFLAVVKVCFNLMKHSGLAGKDLTGRWKWLAEEWDVAGRVSTATSRRYLKEAAEQFENQITSGGFVPVTASAAAQTPETEALAEFLPFVNEPGSNTVDSACEPSPVPPARST